MADSAKQVQEILERIRQQAGKGNYRVTIHAHQEMVEDSFVLDDVLFALENKLELWRIIPSIIEVRVAWCME